MCIPYFKTLKFSQKFGRWKDKAPKFSSNFQDMLQYTMGYKLLIESFLKEGSHLQFPPILKDFTYRTINITLLSPNP